MFTEGHILEDGAAARTASGYGSIAAAAKTVNLGNGLVRGNVVIDVSDMTMQSNDELYQLHLMGGDDSDFTKEVALATLEIGCMEVIEGSKDSKIGRYILAFENEQNGVIFPYVRIRHAISGTTPSLTYTARLEKDLPVRGRISATATTTT